MAMLTTMYTFTVVNLGFTIYSSIAAVADTSESVHPIHTVSIVSTDHSKAIIMTGNWKVTWTVNSLAPFTAVRTIPVLCTNDCVAQNKTWIAHRSSVGQWSGLHPKWNIINSEIDAHTVQISSILRSSPSLSYTAKYTWTPWKIFVDDYSYYKQFNIAKLSKN